MKQFVHFLAPFLLLFTLTEPVSASQVRVTQDRAGWQLWVDGQPYMVRGVCYYPTKVGESPNDGNWRDWTVVDDDHDGRNDFAYQSWVDKNKNNRRESDELEVGDFKLLQDLGCNTIRLYHHASTDTAVQAIYKGNAQSELLYNHPPNKTLLNDLFKKYGIRVAMGDFLGAYTAGSGAAWESGTDYNDKQQKQNMLRSVEAMVKEFRHEPYILMWVLGNENNYEMTHTNAGQVPAAYAAFVNEVAKRIHELDPRHPVCLSNGDTKMLSYYAKHAPAIDIFGINSYRDPAFGTLWQEVAEGLNKPVLLTEFGEGKARFIGDQIDEDYQASQISKAWCDIHRHASGAKAPRNAIGGFIFEWMDNWWQNWGATIQNHGQEGWEQEWMGLASQGDGQSSPFLRQLRKSYFAMQDYWTGKKSCEVGK